MRCGWHEAESHSKGLPPGSHRILSVQEGCTVAKLKSRRRVRSSRLRGTRNVMILLVMMVVLLLSTGKFGGADVHVMPVGAYLISFTTLPRPSCAAPSPPSFSLEGLCRRSSSLPGHQPFSPLHHGQNNTIVRPWKPGPGQTMVQERRFHVVCKDERSTYSQHLVTSTSDLATWFKTRTQCFPSAEKEGLGLSTVKGGRRS